MRIEIQSLGVCFLMFLMTAGTRFAHALSSPVLQSPTKGTITTLPTDDQKKRTVTLPLIRTERETLKSQQTIHNAFDAIVDGSDFLISSSTDDKNDGTSSCRVPAMDESIVIDFYYCTADNDNFVLSICNANEVDFGWICLKFYQERSLFEGMLDTDLLREQVMGHLNREPAHPGYAATEDDDAGPMKNLISPADLHQLEQTGYLVVDNLPDSFQTNQETHEKLSAHLTETTGDHYRKDKVHFLARPEATTAGLQGHFDMLMSIAAFLNRHLTLRESSYQPIHPATLEHPLTNPSQIQLAQYGQGDYYVAHSDNSIAAADCATNCKGDDDDPVRNNFRHYTCILYCNNLEETDGGALRLYPASRDAIKPMEATTTSSFVDVRPRNGRLLIFDSCLVHSVQEVTSATKLRRALTLWINRPNDSGVKGEKYY